jgi:drug/metabolite transporter (DMT)-like permease
MVRVARVHRCALLLAAAAACWGVATVVSKRAVAEIAPLILLPIELFVSVVVLTVVAGLGRRRVVWTCETRRLAGLGVINPGLAYALGLAGLARVTASVSVLLWAFEPVLILVLAVVVLRDHVRWPVVMCAGFALAGVVLVVFQPGNDASTTGIALTLAGVAACAVYTVLSSKFLVEASTVTVVLVQQVSALLFAVVLFAVSLLVSGWPALGTASATAWLSAAGAGALYYGVAFCFYLAGLRGVTPGFAGVFINLVPVFGIVTGFVVLGERLSTRQWGGGLLVVAAVAAAAIVSSRLSEHRAKCVEA